MYVKKQKSPNSAKAASVPGSYLKKDAEKQNEQKEWGQRCLMFECGTNRRKKYVLQVQSTQR